VPADVQESRSDGEIGATIFDGKTIKRRVAELGHEICVYYETGDLLLIGLLKGSFIFLADLVRSIQRPHKIDFCVVSSYGSGTESSGLVRLLYDPTVDVRGHHVLLVEDVVETGRTLNRLVDAFRERQARSVEIVTLLHKRVSSALACEPRFVGFQAPREFLVGYGLDYDERYRHLPFVASLKGQDG
jgi:hypoxanthine phosphoribosyltransferase